jgi:drug/metabolite transporter (DMT)-like permease
MAAVAEIPRNRRRWVLPAALVVVGVLVMVIGASRRGDYASAVWLQLGSALALFGPLYGAQRMLERGSPSESPGAASPPALGCEASTSR